MSSVSANDHPDPEEPLHYAPRSVRYIADPRSNAISRSDQSPPPSASSRYDEMREQAFAKFARPLESQFVDERRPRRVLLATVGGIAAAIGVAVIVALVFFNVLPRSKNDPSELAVSVSTPASATPAQMTSEDSQALLQGFKQFQSIPGSGNSEPASSGAAKEGPEKPPAMLEKFIQWREKK